jgi:hypothetical protein
MGYNPRHFGALCDQCPLNGSVVVPPEGPSEPEFVIVGEGPGYQEEKKRRPFVGASGIFLDEILETIGLARSSVLITNAVLCRAEVPDPNVPMSKRYDIPTYLAWIRKENARRKKMAKGSGQIPELITDPFMCCHGRLMRELHWADRIARDRRRPNGAVVVALGNKALEMTTGKAGIMKWRGSPLNPIGENP